MPTALELLITACNEKFDELQVSDAALRESVRYCANASPSHGLAAFGQLMVRIVGHSPFEGSVIDRVDVSAIFDKAEAASLDVEGAPTEATDAINDLWGCIEHNIPIPDFSGHSAEVTGYYGR